MLDNFEGQDVWNILLEIDKLENNECVNLNPRRVDSIGCYRFSSQERQGFFTGSFGPLRVENIIQEQTGNIHGNNRKAEYKYCRILSCEGIANDE